MTKEELELKFEDCFDAATHATGGGYEADCTSKDHLWESFKPFVDEYAKQFTLDFNKFLEEHTQIIREEKITLYRYCDTKNEYGNYTLEDILTEFKDKYYPQ